MAGAVAACLTTLRLTQVSLLARPRPRSVLLCVLHGVLTPWLSSMAQPDLRLPSVGGRSLPDAHPDLLPSCGAFRACVSPLKSVCSMNSKIVTM